MRSMVYVKLATDFFMGNTEVTVDTNSNLYIRDKHFEGTRGLWELLPRSRVDNRLVSEDDLKQYEHLGFNQRSFGGLRTGCPNPHSQST